MLSLTYSTNHEQSAPRFAEVIESYLGARSDTMSLLEDILQDDPTMPMALLFRGCILKLAADPRFRSAIDQCIAAATKSRLNPREQKHLEALKLWQADQMVAAARCYDKIAREYPEDIVALRMAHYLYFYSLGGEPMKASILAVLDAWHPELPYYGYLMGMLAFSMEESGQYDEAESYGKRALDINPADVWAAHAVTHVYQMREEFDKGLPFIASMEANWGNLNNFVNHMYWHNALQFIGSGQPEQALRIYDELLVKPLKDDFYLDVCNAASLLWRLDMLGIDTGDRWQGLLALSQNRIEDDELVFTSLHYLMAPAVLGDSENVEKALGHYQQWASGDGDQQDVTKAVGEPMARAISLLGKGEHRAGAELLKQVEASIHLIGGSHAQRHLFSQLIEHYQ